MSSSTHVHAQSGVGGRPGADIRDRARLIDPTGTTAIRSNFRAAAQRLLNRWRQLLRVALLSHDVFGHSVLRAGRDLPVESLGAPAPRQFAWLPPDAKLKAFTLWAEQMWDRIVVAPQTQWWHGYLRNALGKGLREAEIDTGPTQQNYRDVTNLLAAQIEHELLGIGHAAMQAVGRLVGDHVHCRTTPLAAYREITKAIDKIAVPRLDAMANTYTVKGYNRIKLAVYRNAGLSHVGVIPERILVRRPKIIPVSTIDAAVDPWEFERRGEEGEDLVNWLTSGDDDVCELCEDLADGSPYTLDDAEDLYPAHPHCRCAVVPLWDSRFAR